MSKLLTSFQVKNFRLFEDLKIESLSRVNLITGKNNTGKTSLLEAIGLYKSEFKTQLASEILIERDEDYEKEISIISDNPLRFFFKGYNLPKAKDGNDSIIFKSNLNEYKIGIEYYVRLQDGRYSTVLDSEKHKYENIQTGLFIVKNNNEPILKINLLKLDKTVESIDQFYTDSKISPIQFVFHKGYSNYEVTKLLENLEKNNQEAELVDRLKIIDPRIKGLTKLYGDKPPGQSSPWVELEGVSRKVPLGTLGGGVTKIFHVILALANLDEGCLLLDEIENGLHWTVQEKMWQVIFDYAKKKNVQIFATTHSLDCIRAFQKIWEKNPNYGSCIRLQHHEKKGLIAVPLHIERLGDALDTHVEVR